SKNGVADNVLEFQIWLTFKTELRFVDCPLNDIPDADIFVRLGWPVSCTYVQLRVVDWPVKSDLCIFQCKLAPKRSCVSLCTFQSAEHLKIAFFFFYKVNSPVKLNFHVEVLSVAK